MLQTISQGRISGTISAIPSKSAAHRLYICAALAEQPTEISCQGTSKDIEATKACLAAIRQGETINVSPGADYAILQGDVMVVLGGTDALSAVQKL